MYCMTIPKPLVSNDSEKGIWDCNSKIKSKVDELTWNALISPMLEKRESPMIITESKLCVVGTFSPTSYCTNVLLLQKSKNAWVLQRPGLSVLCSVSLAGDHHPEEDRISSYRKIELYFNLKKILLLGQRKKCILTILKPCFEKAHKHIASWHTASQPCYFELHMQNQKLGGNDSSRHPSQVAGPCPVYLACKFHISTLYLECWARGPVHIWSVRAF